MANEEGERSQRVVPTVFRSTAIVALAVCFVAGYLMANWWWTGASDTRPLAQICARIDYVDGLLGGPEEVSKRVRDEFEALVEQCRAALEDRTKEYGE